MNPQIERCAVGREEAKAAGRILPGATAEDNDLCKESFPIYQVRKEPRPGVGKGTLQNRRKSGKKIIGLRLPFVTAEAEGGDRNLGKIRGDPKHT